MKDKHTQFYKISTQKFSEDIEEPKSMINKLNLIDI